MAWTKITRLQYGREALRYASDLTDAEWALVEGRLPARRCLGRPRRVSLRAVLNGLLYMAWSGCQWRALPRDFPARSTVQGYFYRWRDDGTWQEIALLLAALARRLAGRAAAPSAGVIDSQSVATSYGGGPRGLDPAKRIKGRKRHIVTDTDGLLLAVDVHPANVQDCHGAAPLLREARKRHPTLGHIFADRVYRGPQLQNAVSDCGPWTIQIVERPQGVKGFQLLPRRWVVERSFAWLGRCRRLSKDFEATTASAIAWIFLAQIRLLSRRLARAQSL
ncbi:MAG: IS5 family transposase [Methylocystis sp.]